MYCACSSMACELCAERYRLDARPSTTPNFLKTLQYIMGYSDISITLNTYTHLKNEDVQEEFDRVMEA